MDWIAIPDGSVLAAFFLAGVVLILTPGPDMTLLLSRTLSNGRASGLATIAGTSVGGLVHSLLTALGISALLATSPQAFAVLKIVGALYLAWLAVQALRKGAVLRVDRLRGAERHRGLRKDFAAGVAINLLNPKIVLFFVTFLPQFVSVDDPQARGKLLFLGLMFVAMAVPALVAMVLFADRFARALTANPSVARLIDWLFATIFGAFAIRIALAQTEG